MTGGCIAWARDDKEKRLSQWDHFVILPMLVLRVT